MDVPSRPESLEYDYARVSVELDPVELKKLFRGLQIEAEEMPRASLEISIGDLDNTASSPDTDLKQSSGVCEKSSVSSCTGDYENCLCKNITKQNCSTGADGDGEGVKPTDLRPAASYEDLSGGCHIDPEEYTEMGKRRSTLIVEGNDSTDHEVEDNGHEYFVLERVIEFSEGNFSYAIFQLLIQNFNLHLLFFVFVVHFLLFDTLSTLLAPHLYTTSL